MLAVSEFPVHPAAVLAVLTLAPVLVIWIMGAKTRSAAEEDSITAGLLLAAHSPSAPGAAVTRPMTYVTRTQSAAEARDLVLGLRHAPVQLAAPVFKHCMASPDPALSLYAQSLLQQGVTRLQTLLHDSGEAARGGNDRAAASMLETGLCLASPTLASGAERAGLQEQLAGLAGKSLNACPHSPRLLLACIRVYLAAGSPREAAALLDELPAESPQAKHAHEEIRFRLHNAAVAAA